MLLRTRDHRDIAVPLHPAAAWRLLRLAWPPSRWPPFQGTRLIISGLRSGLLPLFVGTLLLLGVTTALLYVEGAVGMYLLTISPIVTALLGAAITLMLAALVAWRRLIAAATDLSLRSRACPSCNYPLQEDAALVTEQVESPQVADGPTAHELGKLACPECGCQWRIVRVGSVGPEPVRRITISW